MYLANDLALVVNLGMIWCFGFFFLELLDDCDEESNNDDALASLDDADRKLGSDSDKRCQRFDPRCPRAVMNDCSKNWGLAVRSPLWVPSSSPSANPQWR